MNVLSLFDGISCGRVALQRIGIPVANYYASEIDPYAIKIAKKNYPDTIHIGDVTKVKGKDLPQIDLILAGSPCQGFSHNGAKLGFDDPRSRLFWEFVRLIEECKPTWWLLENVRMKPEWSDIITGAVGYEPILINSALVSAQRRMRLYWTNIPQEGLPEDKGLVLKDILEKPVAEEQPMTDREGKAYCLTATYGKCGNATTGATYESEIIHNTARHQRTCIQVGLTEGRQPKVLVAGKSAENTHNGQGHRVYSPKGKVGTLGTSGTHKVLTNGSDQGIALPHASKPVIKRENWRMLTPKECERLQTLPDDYTEGVSNTQRYKALGNGWTVDVVAHLLQGMK